MKDTDANSKIHPGPALVIVALQGLAVFGTGMLVPSTPTHFFGLMGGPILGLLALFVWWWRQRAVSRSLRILGIALPLVTWGLVAAVAHPSMVPMTLYIYAVTIFCLAFVACVVLTLGASESVRRVALIATILLSLVPWALLRTDGVDGNMAVELAGRWQTTAEEKMLAAETSASQTPSIATSGSEASSSEASSSEASSSEASSSEASDSETLAVALEPSPWPGFRGPARDGVVPGLRIATDWQASPPRELWRRAVGPGWGSFSTGEDLLFTQEQRGDEEAVSAYRASTGEPVWRHLDAVRFWETQAGAGPRGTPMVSDGVVYSLGATGLLNALKAQDGSLLWQRDLAADTGAPTPEWGFSSSPLVHDGLVIVHAGGPEDRGVAAYDAATGEPRWFAPAGTLSYSSPHLSTLGGTPQILVPTGDGLASYAPGDGRVLWQHPWPMPNGARIVQPVVVEGDGVLIGTGFAMGLRRVDVSPVGGDWQVEERWTTTGLKPYYNDLVAHRGYAYGFDGRILAAVDLETGERVWKGGRYGNGQMVLLPAQDVMLVLSDRGDIALVEAKPEKFQELARMPAIDGKTWNHPMVAGQVLYVRNGEEMAAFALTVEDAVASLER